MTVPNVHILTNKRRPAPFLVCTYTFGEGELPTVKAARDVGHATELMESEARASCQPTVRVYAFDDEGNSTLAMGMRE